MAQLQQLLQGLGGKPAPDAAPAGIPAATGPAPQASIPPAVGPAPAPAPGSTPPVPAGQQGFTAEDIRRLYSDPKKLSDIPRALKNLTPGPDGTYTLDQLRGLRLGWMTDRSRTAWNGALEGLAGLGGAGKVGPGGGLPGYTPASPDPQPTPPAPIQPTPGTLSAPWTSLYQTDPMLRLMFQNALQVTGPTPPMNGKGPQNLLPPKPPLLQAQQFKLPQFPGISGIPPVR